MSSASFETRCNFVGTTIGGVRPRLLQCGHVELIENNQKTTVQIQEAFRYASRLSAMLADAIKKPSIKAAAETLQHVIDMVMSDTDAPSNTNEQAAGENRTRT